MAVGLTADIKVGSKLSYEVIKIDGEERFCEWDIEEGGKYQEVPKWLFPVKATADFVAVITSRSSSWFTVTVQLLPTLKT